MTIPRRTFGLGLAGALLLAGRHAKAASDEELARLIIDGKLEDALRAADHALAAGQVSDVLRRMTGALRFADGDFSGAVSLFEADELAGEYLMGGPLDADVLKTHVQRESWRHLASLRAGKASADAPQIAAILSSDVEIYAEQQAARERLFYDSLVLSIASSSGRTQFLDNQAARSRAEHRCTAHFVRAELAVAAGRTADARASLDAAAGTAQSALLEYHVARAERARLG